jgi:ATP-dependent DNA helicase RecQ
MSDDLPAVLKKHFRFRGFRPGQEQVMRSLLAGRPALALFPTGAGKSLCYQLPALLMEGVTLVISPLIALMKDQVERLRARGIAAARLDSSLTEEQVMEVFQAMASGRLKLLYVAPERLLNERFVERLKGMRIAMMAIDEAHCISEWGHSFRPEYLRLAHVARELGIKPVLALTATATPQVAADICKAFGIEAGDHVQTSFLRANLQYRITPCEVGQRLDLLTRRLQKRGGPAIVYVTLQRTAEQVATHLQRSGLKARAYHAGMPAEHRSEAQEAFMGGAADVIVATIAFGMGIDKADIRAVYHYNLPKTIENYQQETGRAGRDGKRSVCELLACRDDCVVLENFVYGDAPTAGALRQLVDHLLRRGEVFEVSMYDLSHATDIRPMVIETVITYLELEGILKPLGSVYATYQWRLMTDERRVLAGHAAEQQQFLKELFAAGKKGMRWTTVDVEEVMAELGVERERVLKALSGLEESGEAVVRPSGVRQRYRLVVEGGAVKTSEVANRLGELFARREARDIARLRQVLEFAGHPGCLTRWLLGYFGEVMAGTCGSCESCKSKKVGETARPIPGTVQREIGAEEMSAIQALIQEGHPALRGARQVTRFLCGLSSPASTRARLGKHDAFGLLERLPFAEVLGQVETMTGRG